MADDSPEASLPDGILDRRHRSALATVATWARETAPGAALLSRGELLTLGFGCYEIGWRLPTPDGGELILLLDAAFPYSLPRVAVAGRPDALGWPHVEAHGKLCLAPAGAPVSTLDPVAVVQSCLHDAERLLVEDAAGGNDEDYRVDLEAYWRRTVQTLKPGLRTFLTYAPPSRIAKAWHGEAFYLVADTADDALRWMTHRHGADKNRTVSDSAVIWLDILPTPDQYPGSAEGLRSLVAATSSDGSAVLDRVLTKEPYRAAVVLLGKSPTSRVAAVGVELRKPETQSGKGRHARAPTTKGFRPGHVPARVLAVRYGVRRIAVERVDALHTRTDPSVVAALRGKSVAVIGCGSLGSTVARMLVQAGVGRLLLIDPDSLAWANIGRHELGAESVNKGKATALAEHLRARFPHVHSIQAKDENWIIALKNAPGLFAGCDLVVAATGDWNAESALNDLHRAGGLDCPVVYGWMEERAAAAHALAVGTIGACLRCGFGPTGSAAVTATIWPNGAEVAECGGGMSVYGAGEVAHGQSLLWGLAIDVLSGRVSAPVRRVWLTPTTVLATNGGAWNPDWKRVHGDPEAGGIMLATPWLEKAKCPGCSDAQA